jgi:rhodanese-related sulfurtransferase
MKKIMMFVVASLIAGSASAYNKDLASSYEQYFAPFAGKETTKALQLIKPNVFVYAIKKGDKMLVLDIRTPAEVGMVSLAMPGSLAISMDQVFKPANLARIPTDKYVVVVCQGGVRAMAIATALRNTGFSNIYVLKGGAKDLVKYLNQNTAY